MIRTIARPFLAATGLALAACGTRGGGPGASQGGIEHELGGVQAPDFSLPAQSGGKRASLADARGKVGIVDFWATWCEPCRESFPFYQGLAEKSGGDVVVIGLSEDDGPDGIPTFAQETGAKFVLAWDEGKSVAHQYKPTGMPTSFFLDRNGIVQYVHEGFRAGDEEALRSVVADVAAR